MQGRTFAARSRVGIALLLGTIAVAALLIAPPADAVDPVCGTSGGHTLCVTFQSSVLTGEQLVTVTNSPNNGTVIFHWIPTGKPKILVQTSFVSSPTAPQNYSFVWPTQK